MKRMTTLMLIAVVATASVSAYADTRTLQLWTCTVIEGKTPADVQTANGKWVKFVNSKVKGGDIRSFVVSAVTGDLGQFMYIDSYPSFEAWTSQRAAMLTPEGVAIEADLDSVSKCTSSSLHSSTES